MGDGFNARYTVIERACHHGFALAVAAGAGRRRLDMSRDALSVVRRAQAGRRIASSSSLEEDRLLL